MKYLLMLLNNKLNANSIELIKKYRKRLKLLRY